ncbi:MAG: glycosyltransferase 87 family protein [Chloroflexi bacterium]|nr:glycosyltransferase 87 family protein [Chloroflexota bacterium]
MASDPTPPTIWLYDWHVYAAGAHDVISGELYREPLVFPGWPLPVNAYNLPPASAVWAIPFISVPESVGSIAWLVVGFGAWVGAWVYAIHLLRLRPAWAWTGIAVFVYGQLAYWFTANVVLGNVNHLVLAVLALFVAAHRASAERAAGVLLGLAVATKLWPVLVLVPLARQGRHRTVLWAVGSAITATAIPIAWLGVDAIMPMVSALRSSVPIEPGVAVIFTSALRLIYDWWPDWGGVVVAAGLLAIPARGLSGIGLALIAGVSVIPNIWDHYLPTLLFAGALVLTPTAEDLPTSRFAWLRLAKTQGPRVIMASILIITVLVVAWPWPAK